MSIDKYLIHQQLLKWLQSALEPSATKKNIVVTHHAPTPKLKSEQFKDDIICSAYLDIEESIVEFS